MDAASLIRLLLGLALLIGGAEFLVRGAAGVAARAGLSPLVIGLTVVALGTSAPELAVSISSAIKGKPDLAVGNIVGSNILNILLILGLSAAITPLLVARQLVRLDVPIMIGASVLFWLLGLDGRISRLDGALLTVGVLAYMLLLLRLGRREAAVNPAAGERISVNPPVVDPGSVDPNPLAPRRASLPVQVMLTLGGLGLLVLGSRWLVAGAVRIALALGLPELIIGLTIVAVGTSLPEVASSVMATVRGQRDIAVGNIVGSSIFNILAVLGVSALVTPDGVSVSRPALIFDIPIMIVVAVACLPIFFTGHCIARWEGWLFLGYYAAYTLFLVLDAQHHDAAALFGRFLLVFAVPLTGVTLSVLALRARRALRRGEWNP